MPYKIDFRDPPAGYALTSAEANESVQICFLEFTSTEDGQHFIQRLEGSPSLILQALPIQIRPSSIDHMLAIFHRDGKATVYVNELNLHTVVRVAKPVEAGNNVSKDDVADIERLDIGVQVPEDAGFLFIFSVGWRKGLFYDFGPLGPDRESRGYDIASVLGQAYCHVLFQERFSISDAEWQLLIKAKWFPFVGLSDNTINSLINHIRSEWNPDNLLDDIVAEVKRHSTQMLNSWREHPLFSNHFDILERAVERFQQGDSISCTSLLFPRIEGILRSHHSSLGIGTKPSPNNLSEAAVASQTGRQRCLLLPHRFDSYLREVYFADFDPSDHNIGVSRHSVGHGLADQSEFNTKSAVIGILIIHQLSYFLREGQE